MQDGLCKNSLYLLWKFSDQAKVKESIPFLNGAEAKLRTPFEVQVTVKEKQQIGYLLNQGGDFGSAKRRCSTDHRAGC